MLRKKYRIFNPLDNEVFSSYEPQLWPFYAHEIIAPTIENQDVFAKFILSLIRIENKRFSLDELTYDKVSISRAKRIIKQQFPSLFSDELLDKILARISEMNLISNNRISEKVFNEVFNSSISLSNNLKKMILLQDAVSGEVVPHLDIISDFEAISDSKLRYEIKKSLHKRPTLLQTQKAYNYAKLIEERKINISKVLDIEEDWIDDEDDLDERFVTNFMGDEDIARSILTAQNVDKTSQIIFLSDQPELVYFEFLPYSSNVTGEISFLSPFYDSSNSWFTNLVKKSRSISHDVGNLFDVIQDFSTEKHNEYKIAIESQIDQKINKEVKQEFLQDELFILIKELNQPSLLNTYEQIQKLQKIRARTVNTEYVIFLEELFDLISKMHNSEFNEIKMFIKQGRKRFSETLQFLAGRKKLDIPSIYYDKTRYDQICQLVENKSNKIHFFLTKVSYLLLLEAYMKTTVLSNIIEDDKKFLNRLQLLNAARNSNSHYNDEKFEYDHNQITQEFTYVVGRIIKEYIGRLA